jgi:hypothetical protein
MMCTETSQCSKTVFERRRLVVFHCHFWNDRIVFITSRFCNWWKGQTSPSRNVSSFYTHDPHTQNHIFTPDAISDMCRIFRNWVNSKIHYAGRFLVLVMFFVDGAKISWRVLINIFLEPCGAKIQVHVGPRSGGQIWPTNQWAASRPSSARKGVYTNRLAIFFCKKSKLGIL